MYNTIITSLSAGILTITINRPEKLNALSAVVIEELSAAINEVYTNAAIKAAIIIGAGSKSFVAGADISEFQQLDIAAATRLAQNAQETVFSKIENCPKPIIAAVNGFALGGGCELAMACHFRLAATNARFGQPEVNLGIIPGYGGTQRLVHLIGKGRALELMLSANMIDAQQALQWGLVNHVTAPEDLLPKAQEILTTIISKAPLALTQCIRLANTAIYNPENGLKMEVEAFGGLFASADVKEGVTAFLEKRKPIFEGN